MRTTIVAVLALTASLSTQAPVPVYITSVGAANGFTDPSKDNRDTVKDLNKELRKVKEVRLVDSADEAQIILTVQDRQFGATYRSAFGAVTEDVKIRVRFQAGTVDTELIADWTQAVGRVAKQVREWIAANRTNLQP